MQLYFSKKPNVGRARDREDFGRIIFHTENVDTLYSYMKQDEISQELLRLKTSPLMLHGERGSFIFANQMAINYRLHSLCSKGN